MYELLQLELGASPKLVTQAYRRVVRQYHPDKVGNASEKLQIFHDIQNAYETLTNDTRIRELNEDYYASLPTQLEVGGRTFDIGAFFGMRFFRRQTQKFTRGGARVRALLTTDTSPTTDRFAAFFNDDWFEGENSILDHPDWDILEIMMAGTMKDEHLAMVEDIYHRRGLEGATETPWFFQNMEGFHHFSCGNFHAAMECFDNLNLTIPNNIIFMYRLGLSCEAFYYQAKEQAWHVYTRNQRLLDKSINLYEKAISQGHRRKGEERQHCFTIQKALADLYQAVGKRSKARSIWVRILRDKRRSLEAKTKLKELALWRKLFFADQKTQKPRLLTNNSFSSTIPDNPVP